MGSGASSKPQEQGDAGAVGFDDPDADAADLESYGMDHDGTILTRDSTRSQSKRTVMSTFSSRSQRSIRSSISSRSGESLRRSARSSFRNLRRSLTRRSFAPVVEEQPIDDLPQIRVEARRLSMSECETMKVPVQLPSPWTTSLGRRDMLASQLVYERGDPFRSLSASWLEGNAKMSPEEEAAQRELDAQLGAPEQTEDEDEDDEERKERLMREAEEAANKIAFEESERIRRATLEANCMGYTDWLRNGRKLGNEIAVPGQLELRAYEKPRAKHVFVPQEITWMRAPREVRPTTTGKGGTWCWRSDFVKDCADLAWAYGATLPCLNVDTAKAVAKKDHSLVKLLKGHVEVVGLDGRRELWSPSFVQSLDACYATSDAAEHGIRLSEEALSEKFAEPLTFPQGLSYIWPPSPRRHREILRLPAVASCRAKPALPEMPDRLPCRQIYKRPLDEPWSQLLYRREVRGEERFGEEYRNLLETSRWQRAHAEGQLVRPGEVLPPRAGDLGRPRSSELTSRLRSSVGKEQGGDRVGSKDSTGSILSRSTSKIFQSVARRSLSLAAVARPAAQERSSTRSGEDTTSRNISFRSDARGSLQSTHSAMPRRSVSHPANLGRPSAMSGRGSVLSSRASSKQVTFDVHQP